jgi:hypothetical protein
MLWKGFRWPTSPKAITHFDGSVANAFRTSDWETPNCLAIREGVMPALNEARIALIWPRVKKTSAMPTFGRLAVGGDRFVVNSDGRGADGIIAVLTLGGNLPRLFASSNAASKSSSNSPSLSCLMA